MYVGPEGHLDRDSDAPSHLSQPYLADVDAWMVDRVIHQVAEDDLVGELGRDLFRRGLRTSSSTSEANRMNGLMNRSAATSVVSAISSGIERVLAISGLGSSLLTCRGIIVDERHERSPDQRRHSFGESERRAWVSDIRNPRRALGLRCRLLRTSTDPLLSAGNMGCSGSPSLYSFDSGASKS